MEVYLVYQSQDYSNPIVLGVLKSMDEAKHFIHLILMPNPNEVNFIDNKKGKVITDNEDMYQYFDGYDYYWVEKRKPMSTNEAYLKIKKQLS